MEKAQALVSLEHNPPLPPLQHGRTQKEPQSTWGRRWLAHLADFFIAVIVNIMLYAFAGMPIAQAATPYNEYVAAYNQARDSKIGFLVEMGIMQRTADSTATLSDDEMAREFAAVYLLADQGSDGNWNDPLMEYYLVKALELEPYDEQTAGAEYDPRFATTAQPQALETPAEYLDLLNETFANGDNPVFVAGPGNVPFVNDDGTAKSPRFLLATYTGIGLKEGEGAETNDTNTAFWALFASSLTTLREQAATEAISSLREMRNEIVLALSYHELSQIRSGVVSITWLAAFLLAFALPLAFWPYGQTIGKRVLGFYVVDRCHAKPHWWQLGLRTLGLGAETFWGCGCTLFFVFGTSAFTVPFAGSYTFLIPFTVSISLFLASAISAFVFRRDMLSLHDWLSHTECIALNKPFTISDFIAEEKSVASDAGNAARNIFGEER